MYVYVRGVSKKPAGASSEEYGGLISVSPPEEHHKRRTFCRRGGNPRTRSIPKKAFADSFQKWYKRYQQCVVKDGDYFEGQ
jgi:hypothetical protein